MGDEPLEYILNNVNLRGNCLNVGCQDSEKGILLNSRGMHVTFLDINPAILATIELKIRNQNIKFLKENFLNFKTAELFDLILINRLIHLFNHFELRKILKFIRTHLKINGYCQITWPDMGKKHTSKYVISLLPQDLKLRYQKSFIKRDSESHIHRINSLILQKQFNPQNKSFT